MVADRRLTVVFPGATSPPRDGASSFVRAVLELLVRTGYQAHLVVPSFLDPAQPLEASFAAQSSRWLRIPTPAGGLRSRLARAAVAAARSRPAWIGAYARSEIVAEARASAGGSSLVVGFGAAASPILQSVDAPSLLLLFSLPLDDLERAGGSGFDRRLVRRFQARLGSRHDVVATTTPAEQARLSADGSDAIWLPCPQEATATPAASAGDGRRLLFIADWNYPPNRVGVEFLLERVMPEVWRRHPEVELVVAGKGSAELEAGGQDPRVRRFGEYGALAEVVDGATIGVLPLLAAGGVRTRLLELAAAGVPVVATHEATGGVEPGPGVAAFTPDGFAAGLLALLDSPAAERELRLGAVAGHESRPSDEAVAERWRSAFELAISRHAGSTPSSRPARSAR